MIAKLFKLVFFGLLSKAISLIAPLVLMRYLVPEVYGSIVLLRSTINEASTSLSGSSRIILKKTFFSFKNSKIYGVVNYQFFLILTCLIILMGTFGSIVIMNSLKYDLSVISAIFLVFFGVVYYVLKSVVITKYFILFQSKSVNRFILINSFAEAITLLSCLLLSAYWMAFLVFFISGTLMLLFQANPLKFFIHRDKTRLSEFHSRAVKKFHTRVTLPSVINSIIMPFSIVIINAYIFNNFGSSSLAKISIYIAINGVILAGLSQANDYLQSKILNGSNFRGILIIQSSGALIVSFIGFLMSPLVFKVIGANYELEFRFIPFFIMFNIFTSIKVALSSKVLKYGRQSISLISNGFWMLVVLSALSYFSSEIVRIAAPLFGHIISVIIVSFMMYRKMLISIYDYALVNSLNMLFIILLLLCIKSL